MADWKLKNTDEEPESNLPASDAPDVFEILKSNRTIEAQTKSRLI
jgi:hypothetical protein